MQIEHLDNHTARFTIEVEPERFEKAKRTAAQKLSKRLNIPGFRKGKAPYHIIANYIGEGAIVEDAVEALGNDLYKNALIEAEIEPYGPGQLEDVKFDDTPVFTFVTPLQPTVDLGEYRNVRLDYTAPVVTDKDVEEAINNLLEQHAEVEESHQPVAQGNRITAYVDGRLVSDDATEEEVKAEEEAHEHNHDDEHEHVVDEKTVIHEHDAVLNLRTDNELAPGFIAAIEGATVDETREFDIEYPDDEEEWENLAGKRVHFVVTVKKIENTVLPELNDEFAAKVTANEETPLTLEQLRERLRENIEKGTTERAEADFGRAAIDAIVAQATIKYPEDAIAAQVDDMMKQFDQELRQRGMTLEDYKKIYNKTDEDLFNEYREPASRIVERSLVMRELLEQERLTVTPEQVEAEINRIIEPFGEQAELYRSLFAQSGMRENVLNDVLNKAILSRAAAIAKNEAPDLDAPVTSEADTASNDETAEASSEDNA